MHRAFTEPDDLKLFQVFFKAVCDRRPEDDEGPLENRVNLHRVSCLSRQIVLEAWKKSVQDIKLDENEPVVCGQNVAEAKATILRELEEEIQKIVQSKKI